MHLDYVEPVIHGELQFDRRSSTLWGTFNPVCILPRTYLYAQTTQHCKLQKRTSKGLQGRVSNDREKPLGSHWCWCNFWGHRSVSLSRHILCFMCVWVTHIWQNLPVYPYHFGTAAPAINVIFLHACHRDEVINTMWIRSVNVNSVLLHVCTCHEWVGYICNIIVFMCVYSLECHDN